MMRKPLACRKCGRTETDQPTGVTVSPAGNAVLFGGLDPYNCSGCWDTIRSSECALPHVNGKPIPRPALQQVRNP